MIHLFTFSDLGPRALKLLLSQLRLTCVELKVALKLQGTNFLLHINQLKKKHKFLLNEVASMKKIIDQNISQNSYVETDDGFVTTLPNDLCETGNFDNTTSPNALSTCVDNLTEIIHTPLDVNESVQSNINAENFQCSIVDMATQIVDCIEETMNTTGKHNTHREKKNDDLRNHAINALKGIISESYKNSNASNISAIGNMIDAEEQIDTIENQEYVAIPQASSVTAQCGLAPVSAQHSPESVVVEPRDCEPRVTLDCATVSDVDPHITVHCNNTSHITLQHGLDPGFTLHHCSDLCAHSKKQKKLEKRRQEKRSFFNIRKHITKHLVDTVGEGVSILQFHKIMHYNQDSILTGSDKENVRIIQIHMHANNEASAITIERNMLPSVFSDDSERYYKVEFENNPRNKKVGLSLYFYSCVIV